MRTAFEAAAVFEHERNPNAHPGLVRREEISGLALVLADGVPASLAFGDSGAAGGSSEAARADHSHPLPALPVATPTVLGVVRLADNGSTDGNAAVRGDDSRLNQTWVPEAPQDGQDYVRRNGDWVVAPVGGGGGVSHAFCAYGTGTTASLVPDNDVVTAYGTVFVNQSSAFASGVYTAPEDGDYAFLFSLQTEATSLGDFYLQVNGTTQVIYTNRQNWTGAPLNATLSLSAGDTVRIYTGTMSQSGNARMVFQGHKV
jgi:hypothetical protein